jgi:outer membrane protein
MNILSVAALNRLMMLFACCMLMESECSALTLQEFFILARARDPACEIAAANMSIAAEKVRESRGGMLPSLNFSGSSTKANYDDLGVSDRRFNTQAWTYQLTQPLFRPENYFSLGQAAQLYLQAQFQLLSAESDLAQRVVAAWFDALNAQEVLKAVTGQKLATQRQLDAAKRSFEFGAVSVADVRDAEAKSANVLAQEIQAISDLNWKREVLNQLAGEVAAGDLSAAQWPEGQRVELGKLDDWLQLANEKNPSIVSSRYGITSADKEISKARSGYLPTVDFVVSYNMNNATGSATYTTPVHNKTLQYGIQANVPLFSGFQTSARVGQAVAAREKALGEADQARDQVGQYIRQAYYGLQGASSQIPVLVLARNANKVSVQANQKGYEVGLKTTADVLNAQAQQYQTEKDLAKAIYDSRSNYIRLKILSGSWGFDDFN